MANTLKFGNSEWYGSEGNILAYNDEGGNFKPLLFDFSRGSSATRINQQGLIETVQANDARVDYKDNANGALLLEPSRTNTVLTDDFSNSIWAKINITIASGFTSPDGNNNAYEITDNSTNNRHVTFDGELSPTDGNVYTRSVFVKKGTARYVVLSARHLPTSSGTSWIYDFNINNWVLTGSTGGGQSIEDYGNGWIRLSISHISNSNLNNDFSIGISSGATISDATYSGSGDTLYIYGAQVELGNYPTSYIPTQGTAQTRLADTVPNHLNINPLNIGNSYTLFIDADLNKVVNNKVFFEIENSASNDVFTIRNTTGQIRVYNNLDAQYPTGNLQSNTNKWAIRIDGNSYKIFGADNSLNGTLPTARDIGEIKFYGISTELKINNFNIYNTALSDAECESLVN